MKLLFALAIFCATTCCLCPSGADPSISEEKKSAMEVLESKCNVCHARRNPSRVFTEENMDAYGSSIYEQVFVRKRMPRGSSIRLSEQESNALKNWLNTLK